MSQITFLGSGGIPPGTYVSTLTGNTGPAVPPSALNNINIIGTGSVTVAGNALTNTLTISSTALTSITIAGDNGTPQTGSSFIFTGGTTGLTFDAEAVDTILLNGILDIANGGTNAASFSEIDGTIYFDGIRFVTTNTGTAGQVLTSHGPGQPPIYQDLFLWNDVTGGSANLVTDNGYIADSAGLTTFTMPTTGVIGDEIQIVGKGSGGWKIVYGTGQNIIFGSSTSTTTTGNIASTNTNDCVEMVCTTASLTAPIFTVFSSVGNISIT